MNPMILIGGAVLLYLYFSSQHPSAAPSQQQTSSGTVNTNPGTPSGTSTTQVIPPPAHVSSIQTWTDAQNAFINSVAAGFQAGDEAIHHAQPAAGSPSAGSTYTATPFVLAFYLQNQAIRDLENKNLDMTSAFPGVDFTQQMSAATFWNHIAPWLASSGTWAPAQGGNPTSLSGLGCPSFMNSRMYQSTGWEV